MWVSPIPYLTNLKDDATGDALWTATSRNAEGQFTQSSVGGIVINRDFDTQTGRVNTIQAGSGNSVANFSYSFDVLGNLKSRSDDIMGVTETFAYDSLNRLTQATMGGTTRATSYNSVGNLTSKTQLGSTASNSYTYPTAGQARPYAVNSITGVVNGVSNPSFSYDANGNLLSGAGRTVTWTSFNRVASVTEGGTTLSYTYDAEHQRIKQANGTDLVVYLNDPISGASSEFHAAEGGTWNDYLFAEGERVGMRKQVTSPASVSLQGYVQDHAGSVAVVAHDSTGTVLDRLGYDVWGRRRHADGTEDPSGAITAPTSRGYTDHEHLPGISLINMNARIYDPEVGRFMSADPIIPNLFNSQALNRYSYVYNNPGSFTDSTGHHHDGNHDDGPTFFNPIFSSWYLITHPPFTGHYFGSGQSVRPPNQYHAPGLASVNEDLRQTVPLRDVSVAVDGHLGQNDSDRWGGEKFANGSASIAAEYTKEEGFLAWLFGGSSKSSNSSEFTIGKKKFVVVGGTAVDRAGVQSDLGDIFSTPRGTQMLTELETRRTFLIFKKEFVVDLTVSNNAYAYPGGDAIYLDPGFNPNIQTTSGQIPASTLRIMAHELGHAVFGTRDDGPGRMNNINQNENPVMNSLGQPSRSRY